MRARERSAETSGILSACVKRQETLIPKRHEN
jgi:hypothetical protein